MRRPWLCLVALAALLPQLAAAQAVGADVFGSTDKDDTEVYRAGLNVDFGYEGPEQYWGVRVEKAWFRPLGIKQGEAERGYLRYADRTDNWGWSTQVGSDGDTVLGSASLHSNGAFRQEYFIERDIIETTNGVLHGVYHTFVGAAFDLPAGERNGFTIMAGAQQFTGSNTRLHARLNYVFALKPEWGLTAQLRTRYFRNSHPFEYNIEDDYAYGYYSPRWYAQVLPVLQLRRYGASGWYYRLGVGVGAQKDSESSGWSQSRLAQLELASAPTASGWYVKTEVVYNNIALNSGLYDYLQGTISLTRSF